MKQPLTGISPISFYGSAIISLGLIIFASAAPDAAAAVFKRANDWIIAEVGWFYMLAVGGFVLPFFFLFNTGILFQGAWPQIISDSIVGFALVLTGVFVASRKPAAAG